jgi:hypothetical protein
MPTVYNSIFWANTASSGSIERQNLDLPGGIDVEHSCIQGLTTPFWQDEGNFNGHPALIAPPTNLRLSCDSPCIDAGSTNATPIDTEDVDEDGLTGGACPTGSGKWMAA